MLLRRFLFLAAPCLAVGTIGLLWAVETDTWQHASQADFEKGRLDKLSLRGDGRLTLAPVFTELHDASSNYLWAVAENSKGVVYAGGSGQDGKAPLYRIEAGKPARTVAELEGLEIHALAIDKQDRVYAATAPDGKVYRVSDGGAVETYYDPKAKYIWALALGAQGELYVGTGGNGEIHKVTAAGTGALFYKTEEAHARSLAVDRQGNLIAGTEPGGLVIRISPRAEGFVLYQTSKREVTAVAVDAKGVIYGASVGTKQSTGASAPPPPPPAPAPKPQAAAGMIVTSTTSAPAAQTPRPAATAPGAIGGGSEVVRIEPDGYPRQVWSHSTDIVYAIAIDDQGRAVLGTGNKGNVYRLESDTLSTLLLSAKPTQITALIAARGGSMLAATGNIGKVYRLGPGLEREGSYESPALDAGSFSYWGRAVYRAKLNGGTVSMASRSGNLDTPQSNWSAWAEIDAKASGADRAGGRSSSPAARFAQYRVTLRSSPQGGSPDVQEVELAYLPKNVPPVAELIEATPANYRFPAQSLTLTPSRNITLPALARAPRPAKSTFTPSTTSSTTMSYVKGHIGARWLASDANGDDLRSKLEIRGVNEREWKLLKDDLSDRTYSWDSTAFPDGEYVVRVTVSDAPDNPPAQALTAQVESEPFVIDNTAPRITGLTASRNGNRVEVKWNAADAVNVISLAEYSIDGGEWMVAEPTTRLSDSSEHSYVLGLDAIAAGEHTIAVRVSDRFDNQAVDKTVIR
ncbi:MAG: hypothetical protein R2762_20120 [Bryobacteraceae bacterium]